MNFARSAAWGWRAQVRQDRRVQPRLAPRLRKSGKHSSSGQRADHGDQCRIPGTVFLLRRAVEKNVGRTPACRISCAHENYVIGPAKLGVRQKGLIEYADPCAPARRAARQCARASWCRGSGASAVSCGPVPGVLPLQRLSPKGYGLRKPSHHNKIMNIFDRVRGSRDLLAHLVQNGRILIFQHCQGPRQLAIKIAFPCGKIFRKAASTGSQRSVPRSRTSLRRGIAFPHGPGEPRSRQVAERLFAPGVRQPAALPWVYLPPRAAGRRVSASFGSVCTVARPTVMCWRGVVACRAEFPARCVIQHGKQIRGGFADVAIGIVPVGANRLLRGAEAENWLQTAAVR